MDKKTVAVYDAAAERYAQDWLSQPAPEEIHRVVREYFRSGEPTADIGCGSGRDTAWLNENGYPCLGFDASEGLLAQARARFQKFTFERAVLPDLVEIADRQFQNVLCETVLMHLPPSDHEAALKNLIRILRPGGALSLSWRHPLDPASSRDGAGRLYECIDPQNLLELAQSTGVELRHQKSFVSASSGNKIEQWVLVKGRRHAGPLKPRP